MTFTPLLSVLTPTFNGMPFLPRCVDSVLPSALDGRVEHIVADGGSSDGSLAYLERTDTRWVSQRDRGQSDALNTALNMAAGEWIGWLNCDEFYFDGVLEQILTIIQSDSCDLIYGDFVEVTPENRVIRLVTQHAMRPIVLEHFGSSLPSCTAFVRRSFIEGAGGWNVENKTMMDWELWLEILRAGGRFHYTGRAHAGFTRHDQQASARLADLVQREHAALDEKFGITPGPWRARYARGVRVASKVVNGGYARELGFRATVIAGGAGSSRTIGDDPERPSLMRSRYRRYALS
ncbi:glycosyltransferase [Williamsia herbipolensis]|uniref:glycosyltransferase n=1 Tax=Williamsia herbipolensis TaxID=1603258 RepID=UPI0006964CF5|nr:glycosyltransferase [Williamsia herbipolensis]